MDNPNNLIESELIQQIHNSDAYGSFYDLGTDMGLYRALWSEPGASKTIAQYISYYGKDRQEHEVPSDKIVRSVSDERVMRLVGKWYTDKFNFARIKDENLCFAASWQVGRGVANHGWICIYYKERIGLFHVTAPPYVNTGVSRNIKADRVFGAANASYYHLGLLHYMITGNSDTILGYVDMAYTGNFNYGEPELTVDFELMFKNLTHSFVTFDVKQNKFVRMEEALRGTTKAVVYKGSFNPWHSGHAKVLDDVSEENITVLLLSIYNYDKAKLSVAEIHKRINMLRNTADADYIMVTDSSMFMNNHTMFKERILDFTPVFVMGEDVREKISDEHFKKLTTIVFTRDGKSSTEERSNPCSCAKSYEECTKYISGCETSTTEKLDFNYEQ